jgi:transposase
MKYNYFKKDFYFNNFKIAISSIKNGLNKTRKKFQVSKGKVYYWKKKVLQGQLTLNKTPVWGGNRQNNHMKLKIIFTIIKNILNFSSIYPFSLQDISNILKRKFNINYSKSSIQRLLKSKKFSYVKTNKVYMNKFKAENVEYFKFYSESILPFLKRNFKKIIFLDEVGNCFLK